MVTKKQLIRTLKALTRENAQLKKHIKLKKRSRKRLDYSQTNKTESSRSNQQDKFYLY
jgi:hypothetical protein